MIFPQFCEFIRHYDSLSEARAAAVDLPNTKVYAPTFAVFCNEQATSVVRTESSLTGRVRPFRFCGVHGRTAADEIAARL